jgi:hypothetical protein
MKALRTVAVVLFIALVVTAFAFIVKADEMAEKTNFTFSAQVELRRITLPGGHYVRNVLESLSDRNLVQVFNKEQTYLYATFLTIPIYRPQQRENAVVRFSETAAIGLLLAKEWFYPVDPDGWEFVYPRSRAIELAKAANNAAPSMPPSLEHHEAG